MPVRGIDKRIKALEQRLRHRQMQRLADQHLEESENDIAEISHGGQVTFHTPEAGIRQDLHDKER